jgi:cell division transport system ATP-binding protein
MVKFEDVTKVFGSTNALEDVSFEVKEGEFVFITGHSGAGKTTLLRLLLREMKPDKGKILIDGVDISKLLKSQIPLYRRKLGVVFQDFKLLPDRTVWENVALALEVSGEDLDKSGKIDKALEEVGLSDKKTLFPRQLAGGEQQRVVIARALVTKPKLILADEPTGNLDPATSRQIIELLDHAAKAGTTVIMATHNELIVNSMKRRVLLFKKGKLASDKSGKYEE